MNTRLKGKRKKIKKKKKDTKVHSINNFKNDNGAVLTDARHRQFKECFVLLSDFNKPNEIHESHEVSTSKSSKISSEDNNEYSSIFNTRGKEIKKINEKESKVQSINSLKNDIAVLIDAIHYSLSKECFVILSDFNEHQKIHISYKASTSKSAKISSENNNEYSSLVNTKQQNIKKKKKVKRINNFINDDAVVHTEKRHCNQLKECFVLLSDFNKPHEIHKSQEASTSKSAKISS